MSVPTLQGVQLAPAAPGTVLLYVCMYVLTSFPFWETLSAAKTVAVLANSCFATPRGAESFWWSLYFNWSTVK